MKLLKLISCLIILALLGALFSSCGIIKTLTNKDDPETESETETTPFVTDPIIPETTTAAPVIDDPVVVTQEPETEPPSLGGQSFSASGTINSESNQLLKLNIEWLAYQSEESEYADVELNIYLECYAITVGGRTNSTVTVDGEKTEFRTDRLTNEENSRTSIKLHTEKRQIHNPTSGEIKSVDVAASFYFGGSYGGEAIGWLETAGTIQFVDDGTPIPDPSSEPEITDETIEVGEVGEDADNQEIAGEDIERDPLAPELPEDPFVPPVEGE